MELSLRVNTPNLLLHLLLFPVRLDFVYFGMSAVSADSRQIRQRETAPHIIRLSIFKASKENNKLFLYGILFVCVL